MGLVAGTGVDAGEDSGADVRPLSGDRSQDPRRHVRAGSREAEAMGSPNGPAAARDRCSPHHGRPPSRQTQQGLFANGHLFSALFAVKVVLADRQKANAGLLFWAITASIFAALMIVAAGLHFLLLSALFYAPATVLFVIARREQKAQTFSGFEWAILAVLLVAAAAGVYGLMSGAITI